MKWKRFKKKGFISFLALVMAMIVSAFCVNIMGLTNTNNIGIFVKRSLDKATLHAINSARYNGEDAESYIIIDDAVNQFAFLAGKSFGLNGSITLNPVKNYNGKDIVFYTDGYQNIPDNRTMLSKTPNIVFAVFNYEDLVGTTRAESSSISDTEKLNEFKLLIKTIISETKFTNNSSQNDIIQSTILKNLFPEDSYSYATPVITKVQPITVALAEIPIDNSAFGINTIYRFSLGKLNVNECNHIYVSDCATTCYKCGKTRIAPVSHTREYPCSTFCSVCGEPMDGAVPHKSAYPDENYPCNETIRCIYCNSIIVGNTSHDIGPWETYQEVSCTENGIERAYCQREGCSYYDERTVAYATGHNFVSATCSQPLHCSKCGLVIENSELPHTFGEWTTTKAPTCLEGGTRERTCSVCGYTETSYIDKTNHIWGTPVVIQEATTTNGGILEQECTLCHTTKQTEIPKLNG